MFIASADGSIRLNSGPNAAVSGDSDPQVLPVRRTDSSDTEGIPVGPSGAANSMFNATTVMNNLASVAAASLPLPLVASPGTHKAISIMISQGLSLGLNSVPPTDAVELQQLALHQFQIAELARIQCRNEWIRLCVTSQKVAVRLQIIFTKLQGMVEIFVKMISESLRIVVVFESSALANIQYDIQMLFKVCCDYSCYI